MRCSRMLTSWKYNENALAAAMASARSISLMRSISASVPARCSPGRTGSLSCFMRSSRSACSDGHSLRRTVRHRSSTRARRCCRSCPPPDSLPSALGRVLSGIRAEDECIDGKPLSDGVMIIPKRQPGICRPAVLPVPSREFQYGIPLQGCVHFRFL